jgi:hypothetical protein
MTPPADSLHDLFPPPIAISGGFLWKRYVGGIASLVAAVVVGGLYIGWQLNDLRQLQRDTELYESATAVSADDVDVEGEVTTQAVVLAEYKLKVTYTDKAGARHTAPVEFDTLPELEHMNFRAVHYDPADPTRFALNLAVKERGKRLGSILFLAGVGGLLIGGSLAFLGWALMGTARAWRRISRNGRVVLCTPVKTVEGRQYGRLISTTCFFRVPAGPRPEPFDRKQVFRPQDSPLAIKGQVVGMYSPDAPTAVHLLGADFQPLELTPEEKTQARRRLEADSTP